MFRAGGWLRCVVRICVVLDGCLCFEVRGGKYGGLSKE
jgi:hypothetical protein